MRAAEEQEYRDEGKAMATAHAAAQRCEGRTGKAMEHGSEMKAMAKRMHAMADEMEAMVGMDPDAKADLLMRAERWRAMAGRMEPAGPDDAAAGKAEMSAAAANDLADSAFACIDAGGKKDETGRTVPRSLRHYPHHMASGELDLPHLRNALARSAQAGTADCGKAHLEAHAKTAGIGGR